MTNNAKREFQESIYIYILILILCEINIPSFKAIIFKKKDDDSVFIKTMNVRDTT